MATLTAFQRAHLASVVLAKGHMSRSKGHCALWKTPSENTAVSRYKLVSHGQYTTCTCTCNT